MRLIALTLAAALTAGAAAAETVSALGTWTVTGVRNDPSMQVTALVDDDPSYMGAKLSVSAGAITWNVDATNGQGTYDACAGPRFAAAEGGLAVTCEGSAWGPEPTILTPVSADRLELGWWDGGILTLTRD